MQKRSETEPRAPRPPVVDSDTYAPDDDEGIENYYDAIADEPGPAGIAEDDWAD